MPISPSSTLGQRTIISQLEEMTISSDSQTPHQTPSVSLSPSDLNLNKPPKKSSIYPDPFVVPPLAGPLAHKQTIILLHGRGSTGLDFGPALLYTKIPGHGNLREAFPQAKFVFPTASVRRATIYRGSRIFQWFDNWSLLKGEGLEREELQFEGLTEASHYIQGLVKQEAEEVGGRENVVLGGLSQGCATVLMALLSWAGSEYDHGEVNDDREMEQVADKDGDGHEHLTQGEKMVGAVVGMCGWLPLSNHLCQLSADPALSSKDIRRNGDGALKNGDEDDVRPGRVKEGQEEESDEDNEVEAEQEEEGDDEDDPFQRDNESEPFDDEDPFDRSSDPDQQPNTKFREQDLTLIEKRITNLRYDLLDFPLPSSSLSSSSKANKLDLSFQSVPIFLGHGTDDEKVPISLGRTAVRALRDAGVEDVEWKEYSGLGHWYSGAMLGDLVIFIKEHIDG